MAEIFRDYADRLDRQYHANETNSLANLIQK